MNICGLNAITHSHSSVLGQKIEQDRKLRFADRRLHRPIYENFAVKFAQSKKISPMFCSFKENLPTIKQISTV